MQSFEGGPITADSHNILGIADAALADIVRYSTICCAVGLGEERKAIFIDNQRRSMTSASQSFR
jgi:hypothetical protein